ncbi:MAG: portal protein, partial [Bacilli bacterium]|nr:portal protein [Bacilli bacterium]
TLSGDIIKKVDNVNSYNIKNPNVIDVATNPEDYQRKLLQARQQSLLAKQWIKTNYDLTNKSLNGLNEVRLMYRDSDLMDTFPEIGTALDIFSEETTVLNNDTLMVNISSKSDRIKSILKDLFINRLSINTILPMICRAMCKYGNNFMLLNIDKDNGVMGWKQLPVHEMERYENGTEYPYVSAPHVTLNNATDKKVDDTRFVWVGQTEYIPYRNWQIAHFRLLYDSQFLPYGVSVLHKARRHFRLLSMMEDAMLIYRLDRSIERRVFKINVGAIDVQDVPAYVQEIANNFKRTPIIDPMTGQIDLRKNILQQTDDFFFPVRDASEPSPIEILPAGQNLTAMDDIKFIQNKLLTALRVPKSFLNFEEAQGDGKNLSLMDVRFTRTVNRIQQALLMELNKIAIIHLFLLGFTDELTDFTLTMNNPSSQAEMLELENLAKKITTAKDAVSDPGGGIPLTSMMWAWRHIMKWSDKEIQQNLEEIRLENALAAEIAKTSQIIKRTKIFDSVDNIYGEPDADYGNGGDGEQGDAEGGMPGGGGGAPIGGGDMDFGDDGAMEDDMEVGAEGEMGMEDNAAEDGAMPDNPNEGSVPPMNDSIVRKLNLI